MQSEKLTGKKAREKLYEIMRGEDSFEEKTRAALELGVSYLDAENGHMARIDQQTDHWKAIVSTDPPDGKFPPGMEFDLQTTYCRRTIEADGQIALHDAPAQGWEDDPAFQTHGLCCYHGTTVRFEEEPYGTVCFVSTEPRDSAFSDGKTMFAELIARLLERELERLAHEKELTRHTNLVNVLNRVLRHNLRNDMSVIRGQAQLMADQLDNGHSDALFQKIDSLLELTEKARNLERIIGQENERESADIVTLIEQIVEANRSKYPSASFTVEHEKNLIVPVLPSFERAIEELIENAAAHRT